VLGSLPIVVQSADNTKRETQNLSKQPTEKKRNYTSWVEFYTDCGFDKETSEKYAQLTTAKKFPLEKLHVLNPQFLDKIGIDDLSHQITICEKVKTITI
jgi:hypothetical protein